MRTKILAVFGVLLVVAACSNDALTSKGPAPLVEKSVAIQKDDAICKQLVAEVQKVTDSFKSSHPSPKDSELLDFFTNTALPLYDRALGNIKRVGEPTKDKVDYDATITAFDRGLTQYKQEIADSPSNAFNNKTKAFDDANAKFKAYGFQECGKT